jgi:hypothetical protein
MLARENLVEPLLDVAWSQWTALGVAGAGAASEDAVDLEALLILTAELANDDPRLRDEALDWCSRYHGYISKPRLKQLLRRSQPVTQSSFGGFASALERFVSGRWPAASSVTSKARVPSSLSGKSLLPALVRPPLLSLRLRALFGVGARADVIGAVLLRSSGDFGASDLAFVGYSKRNLADALDMLAGAGLFRSARVGNRVRFSWRRHEALSALLEPLPVRIPPWSARFRLVSACLAFATRTQGKSERLRHVEAVRCLREISGDLQALGIEAPTATDLAGPALEDWMLATITEVIGVEMHYTR